MDVTVPSICRNCTAYCPIVVTVENGKAVKVVGDRDAPAFGGYTCPKGRELPAQHNHPDRLLHCLKRNADGSFAPLPSDSAIAEIARKIEDIIRTFGPRAVAVYYGTGNVTNPNGSAMARAWMNAIKSKMMFSAMAIDKPAANTSIALHGNWVAGTHTFETSDTWMIVGANPVIAKSNGAPFNNPGQRLKEAVGRGLNLVVVDPRRTETAKHARIHLQIRPGEDAALLAGMINVILRENLYDRDFVVANASGLDRLKEAVAGYTLDYVAARTDLAAKTIEDAARLFAAGKRGGVVCATGPSFSTMSNLTFYLGLCLNTLCGRWVREGEMAPYPNVLLPAFVPRAQPYPPYPVFGDFELRVRGLKENASGMPTAALADEILLGGEGQVKALICLSGNPILSWPDQIRTQAALEKLDLLVVLDHQMTPTAQLAHYAFGIPLSLETAATTSRIEALKYVGVARGYSFPWAHYTPRVVDPPAGSDVVEDAAFFFRLAQTMGLQLKWTNARGMGRHHEGPPEVLALDMTRVPTTDEMIEWTCRNSRIPLDEVKKHPHGHIFEQASAVVQPRDPDCDAMLELGDPLMMDDLRRVFDAGVERHDDAGRLLLVSRRINRVMNSVGQNIPALNRDRQYTPAYMNPADLDAFDLRPGDVIKVRSARSEIIARVESDDSLKPGVISVVHGFGALLRGGQPDPAQTESSVTQLVDMDEADPISGIPRMSAISVAVQRA